MPHFAFSHSSSWAKDTLPLGSWRYKTAHLEEQCLHSPRAKMRNNQEREMLEDLLNIFHSSCILLFQTLIQKKRHTKFKTCTIWCNQLACPGMFIFWILRIQNLKQIFIKRSLVRYNARSTGRKKTLTKEIHYHHFPPLLTSPPMWSLLEQPHWRGRSWLLHQQEHPARAECGQLHTSRP